MGTLITIIAALFIFSIIVFVHEFGHFFTAKLFKVKVHEFAIGMGPALFKKQKGETLRFPPSVIPERFERSTHALEGRCSIQLSYGTIKSLRTAKIQVFLQSHKRN